MKQVYTIQEFGSFITGKKADGYVTLPSHTFQQLEEFILSNRGKETEALELMGLSVRRGIGKVITAKNYVGVIAMKDGTAIEILPKVYSAVSDDTGARTRRLLIDMLKTLKNSPYKSLQTANVDLEKLNIFEVFIRMFVDEVFLIVKRGLKCSYETVEENLPCCKGKLLVSQQLRVNHAHRERSYAAYDAYTVNRPENRLLKAALIYLYRHSTSSKNRNDIKILLNSFADVEASVNHQADFERYVPDRNMRDYTTALMWCRVFLMGKSFSAFAGSQVAAALLFPMETLYESYVAALLKKHLSGKGFTVSVQDKSHYLFEEPVNRFALRPDIVVTREADGRKFVLDTKWKILSDQKANYGLSQDDMYQITAYQQKYHAERVILLYPKTELVKQPEGICFTSKEGARVQIRFLDLFDINKEETFGIFYV